MEPDKNDQDVTAVCFYHMISIYSYYSYFDNLLFAYSALTSLFSLHLSATSLYSIYVQIYYRLILTCSFTVMPKLSYNEYACFCLECLDLLILLFDDNVDPFKFNILIIELYFSHLYYYYYY